MNRVRLLPEQVANQIAAGEVVERPASVVKELVENSLDAGAARIQVEILAAGRSLIRVADDGCGLSRDDALLCLERHATSKIQVADDLSRITTMGFRGEAIPSIASVSRFTLTSREAGLADPAAPGTQIVVNGGRILEVRETAGLPGTTVEVRNLFFNVPARRKFLRSDETERAHIQHWLTAAALAHPHVGFVLTIDGRVVWRLPALPPAETGDRQLHALRERLRLLFGGDLALIPVDHADDLPRARIASADARQPDEASDPAPARLWGWMGAPGVSRGTRDSQLVFVNRRPIENRGLNAALVEGYHNALMKGRYPVACLFLEIDPSDVDVNIHPAKREVKFHRERAIRRFVAEGIRTALQGWHESSRPGERDAAPRPPAAPALTPAPPLNPTAATPRPPDRTHSSPAPHPELAGLAPSSATGTPSPAISRSAKPIPGASAPSPIDNSAAPCQSPDPSRPQTPLRAPFASPTAPIPASSSSEPVPLLSAPLRIVGVIGRLYVVLESDRGLVLLDQHAAHERVLYEQLLRRLEEGGHAPSQRLLLPETLELPPKDTAFLRENLPILTRLGVGLSEFGERTFLLDAVPPFIAPRSARRFAIELVDELRAAGTSVNAWRLGESLVAKTVCRQAIKANDVLALPEIEALLDQLRRCDMPYTCPHGRPTLIEMNLRELDKRFGRIQG